MSTYIALLRGINVGGNSLKMRRLVEICAGLGFANTTTLLQSGNVVFESGEVASTLAGRIEEAMVGETRLPVSVIVRTAVQMKKIVAANPFLAEKAIDPYTLHVTFLSEPATKEALKKLVGIHAGADRFHATSQEIFLHCPMGYGGTRLSNKAIEKVLAVKATTRNWNTTRALREKVER